MTLKDEYKCPKCNNKNRVKVYDIINEDKIDKVISKEIFTHVCKKCGNVVVLDYKVIIDTNNYIIYYTPSSSSDIKTTIDKTKRVCDTYDDLKEKILILEDGFNDIVIEFIKDFLFRQVIVENKDATSIRYDSKSDDNIIFYVMGINKNISCSIDFYNKMLKKMKIKKIKNAVLIDKNNYRKYYKMRLI